MTSLPSPVLAVLGVAETARTEPWLQLPSGKRIYMGNGYPDHLTPCAECGRLLRDVTSGEVCGACFGSVGPSGDGAS